MFKIDNVVILAAGRGSRMLELCNTTPKPLLKLGEEHIIEIIIKNFLSQGFKNIYVVVGYLSEKFNFLKDKYSINLVVNENWEKYNNISSLYAVKDILSNTLIINGDVLIRDGYSIPLRYNSCVTFAEINKGLHEWFINIDNNENISSFDLDFIQNREGFFQREITIINESVSKIIKDQINNFNWQLHYEFLILDICKKNNIDFKVYLVDKYTIFDVDNKDDFLKLKRHYD